MNVIFDKLDIKIYSNDTMVDTITEDINEDERKKTLACHASIEFGDSLTNTEIFTLIEELSSCQEPWTCPHGRPTLIKIDNQQLLKLFQRI